MGIVNLDIAVQYIRDKTMADELMYIPNDNTQNHHFFRIQLVIETFEYAT